MIYGSAFKSRSPSPSMFHSKNGSILILPLNCRIFIIATQLMFLFLFRSSKKLCECCCEKSVLCGEKTSSVWLDKYVSLMVDLLHSNFEREEFISFGLIGLDPRSSSLNFVLFDRLLKRVVAPTLPISFPLTSRVLTFECGFSSRVARATHPEFPI